MPQKPNILEDILHFYFSETIAAFPQSARKNLYGSTPSERFKNSLKYLARSAKEAISSAPASVDTLKNKVWLYVVGDNNFNSLVFLENQIGETVFVSPYRYQKKNTAIYKLQHRSRLWHLLAALPRFISLFFSGRPEINRSWDAVFRAGGLHEYSRDILKKYQPHAIIFSNDTTLEPKALQTAAASLGIPSFFIQHSCVRRDFPPLKFTCSFLEGQDALQKYKYCGPIDGDVHLIGIPKLDPYLNKKNTSKTVRRIGICSNLLDPLPAIESLIHALLQQFPDSAICYRPHPSDQRTFKKPDERLLTSNSREVSSFDFLCQQDLVVAGNTSIHYEAATLNVVSIYYKFDAKGLTDDMYEFVKNGLVEQAHTLEELLEMIQNNVTQKKDMGEKARYYNAVLGTAHEGKSQELALQLIKPYLATSN